jgi:hypothetical protein
LAAKLTGWRIDIQGVTEAVTWALQQVNEDPNVLPALGPIAELLPHAANILRQHEQEVLPYTSEELITMRQVIETVRGYYASLRNAERARRLEEELARRAAIEAAEAQRRETIEAALALIPPQTREIPVTEIGLSTRVLGHLEKAGLETVWNVLEQSAEGDEGLLMLEGIGPKSLAEIKQCIEALELAEPEEEAVAEEPVVVAEVAEPEAEAAPAEAEPAAVIEEAKEKVEPELVAQAPEAIKEVAVEEPELEPEPIALEVMPEIVFDEEEIDVLTGEKPKKSRRKRELVFDEELGEVVTVRRRKRGDDIDELDEWEDLL